MPIKPFFLCIIWLFPATLVAQIAPTSLPQVAEVLNGKSFVLSSGDTVRMASLQVPNVKERTGKKRRGDPMGEESKAALNSLISGKPVRLESPKNPRDRKNRIIAQVYLEDGTWVQEAMLKSGFAMVYPLFEDTTKSDIARMIAAEISAREKHLGIWAHPNFTLLTADTAACCIDQFRLVQATVLSVEARRGAIYLNFGKDWQSDFTLLIPKRYARSFAKLGIENWAGKTIIARGWLEERGGPMIELIRPEQLEIKNQ